MSVVVDGLRLSVRALQGGQLPLIAGVVTSTVHGGKREAQAVAARLQADHGGRARADSTDPPVIGLLDRWMVHIAGRDRAPSTLHHYQGLIDRYIAPALGQVRVGQLTGRRLDRLVR